MRIEYRKGPKRKPLPVLEIEPEEYDLKPVEKRVCTFDTETDPFDFGVVVAPFTCGHYDTVTGEYTDFWGLNCIDQYFAWLKVKYADIEIVVYCHNFGNFDAYFTTHYFDGGHKPFIINGRLVRVFIGGQEFRDSYACIPVALGEYQKTEIDYQLFRSEVREVNKEVIRAYQRDDCVFLAELVVPWLEMFGNKLTMASAALPMLRSFHGFDTMPESVDATMRPYYFGGRNQCFATGLHEGDFKVYDINSSYPNVMRSFQHPISGAPRYEDKITSRTHFAHIRAWSLGALPVRHGASLDFPIGTHDFFACRHEIDAGLETKTLRIIKVYKSVYFDEMASFGEFVDTFYKLRLEAKAKGDKILTLFYKLLLNSSYGKFAQDPRKYENWLFDPDEVPEPLYCADCHKRIKNHESPAACNQCDTLGTHSPFGWYLHTTHDGRQIYASPQRVRGSGFFNVATAASITSAARAQLLRGIQAATRPLYCDTDSIICEALEPSNSIVHDPIELGAWDIEAKGDTVCIAGKKLYAIFANGIEVKKASKGVKLTADEIRRVSEGEVIEYANPVPKFSLSIDPSELTQEEIEKKMFTVRKIKRTG